MACDKAHRIVVVIHKPMPLSKNPTPICAPTSISHLHKNPMFRKSFFKETHHKSDLQTNDRNMSSGGNRRGSEGGLSYIPVLPPCKYKLNLS